MEKRFSALGAPEHCPPTVRANGQLLAILQGHTAGVASAVFSPDGRRIVTTSDDKTARVFRVVTLPEIAELLAK